MEEMFYFFKQQACEMKEKELSSILWLLIIHGMYNSLQKNTVTWRFFIYCWQLECGHKETVLIIWWKSQNREL